MNHQSSLVIMGLSTTCRSTTSLSWFLLLLLFFVVASVMSAVKDDELLSSSLSLSSSPLSSSSFNETQLNVEMRWFAWRYAQYLQPWRDDDEHDNDDDDNNNVWKQVYDALELEQYSGISYKQAKQQQQHDQEHFRLTMDHRQRFLRDQQRRQEQQQQEQQQQEQQHNHHPLQKNQDKDTTSCSRMHCLYVHPSSSSSDEATDMDHEAPTYEYWENNNNNNNKPHYYYFDNLEEALDASRAIAEPQHTSLILLPGIHFLSQTLELGWQDSGLDIYGAGTVAEPHAWLSGGIAIPYKNDTQEQQQWDNWDYPSQQHDGLNHHHHHEIRVINITNLLQPYQHLLSNDHVASVFSHDKRLIRARFPNGNPEVAQWGYASPDKYRYSIHADEVLEWHRPPPGLIPTFEFVDFSPSSHQTHPDNVPFKNDSTMNYYNTYASGHGGVCADLWGQDADSYWCSNASAGGWAEVDLECAQLGQLQIPMGMSYNSTSPLGQRLNAYQNCDFGDDDDNKTCSSSAAVGGIIHAWHS